MIRLFINGTAASAGGGLTYLRNVLPHLAGKGDVSTTALLSPVLCRELAGLRNISFVQAPESLSALRRVLYEQTALPELIRKSGAQVLISAGNLALWRSPVPQTNGFPISFRRDYVPQAGEFRKKRRSPMSKKQKKKILRSGFGCRCR